MPIVFRKEGQSIDELIKLFNRKCSSKGILRDSEKRMIYESKISKQINVNNQQQKTNNKKRGLSYGKINIRFFKQEKKVSKCRR